MPALDDHFAALQSAGARRQYFANATLTPVSNGTAVIQLSNFVLPSGWNRTHTTVYFLAPIGYPVARPDTFWTDPDLCLASGGVPVSTGTQQQPGLPPNLRWFSWHPATWNPNRDSLVTYVEMIRRRFEDRR